MANKFKFNIRSCSGSGARRGGIYYANERRGVRVTCPECGREFAARFRKLGPRGSSDCYEDVVPNHSREKIPN